MYKDERIIGIENELIRKAFGTTNILLLLTIIIRYFILNQGVHEFIDLIIIYFVAISIVYIGTVLKRALVEERKVNIKQLMLRELIVVLASLLIFIFVFSMKNYTNIAVYLFFLYSIRVSVSIIKNIISRQDIIENN